jgi:hypothetical protein
MTIKNINMFSNIVKEVPSGTTSQDVSVALSSEYVKPHLLVHGSPYTLELVGTTLRIIPDTHWLEGINIEVSYGNIVVKYIVPPNRYIYSPEQRLYSLSNTLPASGNLTELIKLGLVTKSEKALLDAMGPKLSDLMHKVSKCLVTVFVYDTPTPAKDCTTLVGFRRMQQVMYMFGLDSIVEYILYNPGPERGWFRRARLFSPLPDSSVFEKYLAIEKEVLKLESHMKARDLNTDFIQSVDLQMDPKLPWNSVLRGIVTLFCAIRYTHDNPKFSY